MQKRTFDIDLSGDDNLSYYYNEWHIGDELAQYLHDVGNVRIKLTIEPATIDKVEEMVTVTYKEFFKRASDSCISKSSINPWYFNVGGDPNEVVDIPKSIAREFMLEEEFDSRKHDENS